MARKKSKTQAVHPNDVDEEHTGRGRKPWVKGALLDLLLPLVPEYQYEITGRPKKERGIWFTNVTKKAMSSCGWGLLVDKLLKAGIALQPKSEPPQAGPTPPPPTLDLSLSDTTTQNTTDQRPLTSTADSTPDDVPGLTNDVPPNPQGPSETPMTGPTPPASSSSTPAPSGTNAITTCSDDAPGLDEEPVTIEGRLYLHDEYYTGPGSDYTPQIFKAVRDHIIAWFWYQGHKLSLTDSTSGTVITNTSIACNFKALLELFLEQPRRAQLVQYYAREYWEERIKATFDKEWAVTCAATVAAGREEPQARVNNRMEVARRLLETETEGFKKEMQAAVDKEHEELTRGYEERFEIAPREGKRREWNLQESYQLLKPIADVLSLRYGSVVTIFMAAPHEKGEIETQSVHAGETKEFLPKNWDKFDRMGHATARDSFASFAARCFGAEEMDERVQGQQESFGRANFQMERLDDTVTAAQNGNKNEDVDLNMAEDNAVQQPDRNAYSIGEEDLPSDRPARSATATALIVDASTTPVPPLTPPFPGPPAPNPAPALASDIDAAPAPSETSTPGFPVLARTSETDFAVEVPCRLPSSPQPGVLALDPKAILPSYEPEPDPPVPPRLPSPSLIAHEGDPVAPQRAVDEAEAFDTRPASPSVSRIASSTTPFSAHVSDNDASTPTTVDSLPPAAIDTAVVSTVQNPVEFEPYLSTPLPSARQSAVTTSYEPIAPDASDAESPRKARPIFDFSTVANPQDRGWLQKGFKHLREAKLGPLWDGVVDAFYEHEELMEFEFFAIKFLPKGTRPHMISDWIQSARPVSQGIAFKEINNISAFETQFCSWWWNAQPPGRTRNEDGWPVQNDSAQVDWEKARYSGVNGLWSIMVALCWWGLYFPSADEREGSDWKTAVYDVRYVLWRLLETAPKALLEDGSTASDSPISTRSKNARGADSAESSERGNPSSRKVAVSQEGLSVPTLKRKIAQTEGEGGESSDRRLRKRTK